MDASEERTLMNLVTDDEGMSYAIGVAAHAKRCGMRPFGSVIVAPGGRVVAIASGSETRINPTRHSEMVAIKQACQDVGGLLYGFTLYQTHEPCVMCCGAICHSKLSRVVFGSERSDLPQLFRQRTCTGVDLLMDTSVPPTVRVGVLRDECVALFADEVAALENRDVA